MRLLLVCKTTNLELYQDIVAAKIDEGLAAKDMLARLQVEHDEHYRTLDKLRACLKQHQLSFHEIGRDDKWPDITGVDAVVSVGGDGTLLSASHHMPKGGQLIGVRSSEASVGYLCAAGIEGLPDLTTRLATGTMTWLPTARLGVKVIRADGTEEESEPVLNDILYTNSHPAATTRYGIQWQKNYEEQRSSGIWFATAAGSTAGIKAAGGEQVPIGSHLYQFRVRELYHPPGQQLKVQGGFFRAGDNLRVINHNESALIALDGQHGKLDLQYGDSFFVVPGSFIDLAAS